MNDIVLSAKKIWKTFNKMNHTVLNDLSLDIYKGDFTVIMGSSGAGKSTLLYALSGMDHISQGEIIYHGKDISRLNEKEMSQIRNEEFGFVFQQSYLVSYLTLLENVLITAYKTKKDKKEINHKANELFKMMNVDHVKNHLPSEVSGGEAQRGAIIRSIINDPQLIFADEPTGALNKANSEDVLNLLTRINQNGQSILMVTHDIRAAIRGNRILYLEDGNIINEITLEAYSSKKAKEREKMIQDWLSAMEW